MNLAEIVEIDKDLIAGKIENIHKFLDLKWPKTKRRCDVCEFNVWKVHPISIVYEIPQGDILGLVFVCCDNCKNTRCFNIKEILET